MPCQHAHLVHSKLQHSGVHCEMPIESSIKHASTTERLREKSIEVDRRAAGHVLTTLKLNKDLNKGGKGAGYGRCATMARRALSFRWGVRS